MSKLPLNKAGNRRGMSAGSRKSQFKPKKELAKIDPFAASPQERSQLRRIATSKPVKLQVKKIRMERAKLQIPKRQELPHRRVQKMIDDVYRVDGKSIRKSLMGMAQRLGAPQETLLKIKNLDDTVLEMVYNEDKYLFESYWEYPIYLGEDRGVTIDEIIAKAT